MRPPDEAVAVLVRGIVRASKYVDARRRRVLEVDAVDNVVGNLMDCIVAPVAQVAEVHLHVVTYAFDGCVAFEEALRVRAAALALPVVVFPVRLLGRHVGGGSQLWSFRQALSAVSGLGYLSTIVCRADAMLKQPITAFLPEPLTKRDAHVCYLFRERNSWSQPSGELISDVLFVVPGCRMLSEFVPAVDMHARPCDLHGLYASARRAAAGGPIVWLPCHPNPDERFDSNTDNQSNPYYHIARAIR